MSVSDLLKRLREAGQKAEPEVKPRVKIETIEVNGVRVPSTMYFRLTGKVKDRE